MKNANFSEYCFYLEENFQMYNALPFTFKFPSMKPTLTRWGGLSYQEVYTQSIK